jgi:glycosyltransferase involved in cell wall biosynthesis
MNVLNIVTNQNINFFKNQVGELNQRGIRSSVITPRQQRADELGSAENSRSVLDYVPLYGKAIKNGLDDYDLVHANNGLTAPFAIGQPCRPIVLSLWGSDLMGKYGRLSRYCARFFDEIIVMSEAMKDELGLDAHVIPHGVDLEAFHPIPQQFAREAVGWEPERKHVLFLYDPRREVKNYPLAERVVDRVNDEFTEQIELQVPFPIDHEMVPMYMNAADVLLMTSRREGSPNTIKEALACNLPVVATDVGDVSERVSGVELSYACTDEEGLTEKLRLVLEQEARSNGRSHARDLSLERMGERIESVYERALDS